jgi:hypothetical protein
MMEKEGMIVVNPNATTGTIDTVEMRGKVQARWCYRASGARILGLLETQHLA